MLMSSNLPKLLHENPRETARSQRQQCKDREDPMVQREASIAAEFGCRKAGP